MKRHAILLFCASALLLAGPAKAQTADVTGKWDVSINTGQEIVPAQLTLTKQGDKITGNIKDGRAPDRGEAPVTATIAEKKITIDFQYADADGPMHIVMNGTLDKDTMAGTVEFGTRGQGEWSAKRAAASTAESKPASSNAATKVDVSGTWNGSVSTSSFSSTPTIVLKQDGEKLTGQYVSTQYGSFPLEGTVKGSAIAFAVALTIEGNSLTANFAGTVEKDAISGTVHYGDFAEGTFTAKKK
jgi:hypothetical protein